MNELKFTIYGQVLSQKNSKQIVYNKSTGKPLIVSNKRVQEWKKDVAKQLYGIGLFKGEYPTYVSITIWNKDKRARDLDNQFTSIMDSIVDAGILSDDDCWRVGEFRVKFAGVDKENPRAEIEIKSI